MVAGAVPPYVCSYVNATRSREPQCRRINGFMRRVSDERRGQQALQRQPGRRQPRGGEGLQRGDASASSRPARSRPAPPTPRQPSRATRRPNSKRPRGSVAPARRSSTRTSSGTLIPDRQAEHRRAPGPEAHQARWTPRRAHAAAHRRGGPVPCRASAGPAPPRRTPAGSGEKPWAATARPRRSSVRSTTCAFAPHSAVPAARDILKTAQTRGGTRMSFNIVEGEDEPAARQGPHRRGARPRPAALAGGRPRLRRSPQDGRGGRSALADRPPVAGRRGDGRRGRLGLRGRGKLARRAARGGQPLRGPGPHRVARLRRRRDLPRRLYRLQGGGLREAGPAAWEGHTASTPSPERRCSSTPTSATGRPA